MKLLRSLKREESGATIAMFAFFVGFVLVPLLGLAIEMGRYSIVRGHVQNAADAAALAAAQEVDVELWREYGVFEFKPSVYALAQSYASENAAELESKGVHVQVVSISVNPVTKAVEVVCRADVSSLFPAGVPGTIITQTGTAQVAWR